MVSFKLSFSDVIFGEDHFNLTECGRIFNLHFFAFEILNEIHEVNKLILVESLPVSPLI